MSNRHSGIDYRVVSTRYQTAKEIRKFEIDRSILTCLN